MYDIKIIFGSNVSKLRNKYGNKKEIVDDIKLLLNTLDYDKLKLIVNILSSFKINN